MTYRKFIFTVVTMAAVIGLLAAANLNAGGKCGATAEKNCGSSTTKDAKVECVMAKIKSLDTKGGTIVLTTGAGKEAKDVTMKVCPKAKVTIDGKAKALADLKAGSSVRVCQTKTKKGDLIATRIAVGAASDSKKADCCAGDGPNDAKSAGGCSSKDAK